MLEALEKICKGCKKSGKECAFAKLQGICPAKIIFEGIR